MAITGNPGDLATGGFGTGVRGVAATPRDVANAVTRGQNMAAARSVGQGGNQNIGGGFRGPIGTWGSPGSIVPGSLLARIAASPLAPYGGALNVTQDDLIKAAIANASLLGTDPMNPSLFQLKEMAANVQESPELQGVLGAVYGPFIEGASPSVPADILSNAINEALPTNKNNVVADVLPNPIMPAPYDMRKSPIPANEQAYLNAADQAAFNRTYSGPKGVTTLNPAARMASVRATGLNIPSIQASPADIDAATRMVLAESSNIINEQGGLNIPAIQAVADVIRNRVISDQFPNTVLGVLSQPTQFEPYTSGSYMSSRFGPRNPNYSAVRDVVEAVFSGEAAPVVGGAVNFGNNAIIQGRPTASQKTQQAFAQMVANPESITFYSSSNPAKVQQTFGVLPGSKPVEFGPLNVSNLNVPDEILPEIPTTPPPRVIPDRQYALNPYEGIGGFPGSQPSPSPIPEAPIAITLPSGNLMPAYAERGEIPSIEAPSPAPVVANRTPTLPPRTPTPGLLSRMFGQLTGQPLYQTASIFDYQPNTSAYGDETKRLASSLLASAQPTTPAEDKKEKDESDMVNKPTEVQPVKLSSSLLPDWYWEWYKSRGLTGGLLG